MDFYNADAVAVWIRVFFAVAAVTGVLVITALVALFASSRSAGAPAARTRASRLPDLSLARQGATTHGAA